MKNVMIMCASLVFAVLATTPAFAAVGTKPAAQVTPVEDNPGGTAFTPSGELPNVSCAPCTAVARASGVVAFNKGETPPPGTMRAPLTGQVAPAAKTGESIK